MQTYEKQIPQQGANMNQQKELSTNQIEKLKLICTTLYNVLHLDVATPEVATNLLMHMTFTLGLKIVGANKITYNIPTEAPAVVNLVNVRPPFQCTHTGCKRQLTKPMQTGRTENPN